MADEKSGKRLPYRAPELREYGTVGGLTMGFDESNLPCPPYCEVP
jgi:hypothetical protein